MTAKHITRREPVRDAEPEMTEELWAYLQTWDAEAKALEIEMRRYAQEWDAMAAECARQSSRKPTTTR